MEFRLLGSLEVVDGGRALELGGQKQHALLALLVLEANRLVSRDRLIDALWEDEPTATAGKALQVYVSQLRKALGRDRVVTQPGGYLLRVDRDEVDLARFEHLYADGKPHDALALWRGSPLAEFGHQRFAQAAIARLEEQYVVCLEARIERDLAEGRNVVGELEGLVQVHPLRERLREFLLLALYRSGRQADALAAYQQARAALVEGLGIEPGKRLRELHQAILRQDPALDLAPAESARGVFVGREGELEELLAGLEDAFRGHGRLFLLVGEPGIGKSRLADELIQVARARRVDALVGRCWEASGAPPYWPWVQSLRGYGGEVPPELRGEAIASDDEGARFRLFDATAEFLRHASRERPLLLFLDDMHAADEPSLLLLRFVARELASSRVLLVVACRDVDPVPGRPLAAMLAEVAREPTTTRLSLRGLSEHDVGDYVEAELASRDLASTLYEETEGNPLFLGETVRLLAVEGRIAIPPSLRDVIARRLAHLGDECNRVLVHAAVLGREFDHDALALMSDVSENELLETLDQALAARVVSDVPGALGRSRFAHVLIRDALYDGLTSTRRVRLHRAAVETLKRLDGDDAELAYHAAAGDDPEKALAFARRAGDRALALLAYEEAARLYDVALAAHPDEETRCELLLARGEAEMRAGKTEVAKQTFLAAAAIARGRELPHALARAAAGYGGRMGWSRAGHDGRLVPLLEEGLAALGDSDVELRVRLLARLAGALRDEFSRVQRDALSAEAVELARGTGDPQTLAYALVGRGHAIIAPDTIADMLALTTEVREIAAAVGDGERLKAGHTLRHMTELWLGDRAAIEADLAAATEIARELRQPVHLWEVTVMQVLHALAQGRFAEAESLAEEAFALGEGAIPEAAIPHYRMQHYALAELRDEPLDAIEPLIAAIAEEHPARPVFACAHAHVLAVLGREGDARRALVGLLEALPFDQEWLYGMSLLAETAVLTGDLDLIAAVYAALLPWRSLIAADQSEGCRGSVARPLGLLAAALGGMDAAARHFELALEVNERMGFRPWLAKTHDDYRRIVGVAPRE